MIRPIADKDGWVATGEDFGFETTGDPATDYLLQRLHHVEDAIREGDREIVRCLEGKLSPWPALMSGVGFGIGALVGWWVIDRLF